MRLQLSNLIKRHLLVYFAVSALAIATPQFDARVEAEGGFFAIVEGRGGIPAGATTPWAEEVNLNSGVPVSPTGKVTSIDTDPRFSGRLGMGRRIGSWDFGIFYSGIQTLGHSQAIGNSCTTGYFPLLGAYYNPSSAAIDGGANSSITYNVVDFEAGHTFTFGSIALRVYGGARYAGFDQDVTTLFNTQIGSIREHREVGFQGAGLRLGGRVTSPIPGPLDFTFAATAAVLFGDRVTETNTVNDSGSVLHPELRHVNTTELQNYDLEIGLVWNHEIDNASTMILTLGYRAEAWIGVNNTRSESPTFSSTVYGNMFANQVFHGPLLRGEWRFD